MRRVQGAIALCVAGVLPLVGCAPGPEVTAGRGAEEGLVAVVGSLGKRLRDVIPSEQIGERPTVDQLNELDAPAMLGPDPQATRAPYADFGTATIYAAEGDGETTMIRFWVEQEVTASAGFVSLTVALYGCGGLALSKDRAIRLRDETCPSWTDALKSGDPVPVSLSTVAERHHGGTEW